MRQIAEKYLRRLMPKKPETSAQVEPKRSRLVFEPKEFAAVYAIGDIHGCYDALLNVMARIETDCAAFNGRILVVCLGDYIDRGDRSKDVLEYLCSFRHGRIDLVALCGNHEQSFVEFLNNPQSLARWRRFAGVETLRSYGIDVTRLRDSGPTEELQIDLQQNIPLSHRDFLESLPVMVQIGTLVLVHAGLRPGIPIELQSDTDLMWIREPFLSEGPLLPVTVIHGHTPSTEPAFGKGRVGIDTGAYATGRLTALRIIGDSGRIL
jgi:serine/threonine protein phosphatase 1